MPVLQYIPADPPDLVLQGEQLRASVMDSLADQAQRVFGGVPAPSGFSSLVGDEDKYLPMNSLIEQNRLSVRRQKGGSLQVRSGAGIASPCGAWISLDWPPLINNFAQGTERFQIVGTTRNGNGDLLGGCAVIALETGRMNVPGAPVVGMTTSDGSGAYSIATAGNSSHQVIAYKDGPVAGVSLNTLTPTQV